jgi:hypothetical protein
MAGFGGNRFGSSYGGGGLRNRMMQDELMSMLRKKQSQPTQTGAGFTVQPSMISTGGPGDSAGFNERKKNREMMGRYGKGGILRERIEAENRRAALTSQNERAKQAQTRTIADNKNATTIKAAQIKATGEFGDTTTPTTTPAAPAAPVTGTTPPAPTGFDGTGKPVALPPAQSQTTQPQTAPVSPGGGTFSYKEGTDFSKAYSPSRQPGYKYTLENQQPPDPGFREARTGEYEGADGKRYTNEAPSPKYIDPYAHKAAFPPPTVTGKIPGEYDPLYKPTAQAPTQIPTAAPPSAAIPTQADPGMWSAKTKSGGSSGVPSPTPGGAPPTVKPFHFPTSKNPTITPQMAARESMKPFYRAGKKGQDEVLKRMLKKVPTEPSMMNPYW